MEDGGMSKNDRIESQNYKQIGLSPRFCFHKSGSVPGFFRRKRKILTAAMACVVAVLLFLGIFVQEGSAADNPSPLIYSNVPQTPEALFQAIKALLADPEVDGRLFCEQWLGIPKESWTASHVGYTKAFYINNATSRLFPFTGENMYLTGEYKIRILELWLSRAPHLINTPELIITPEFVRQSFGEPEKVGFSYPFGVEGDGRYTMAYFYSYKNYTLTFGFKNKSEDSNMKLRNKFRRHTKEQAENEHVLRKPYNAHKDYIVWEIAYVNKVIK